MGLFMEWTDKLSVGIKEIDDQHKKLVDITNSLYDSMKNGQANSLLKNILDDLVKYTVYHFTTEEKLMSKYNYADSQIHKKAHDDFTNEVSQLQSKFNEGAVLLSVSTFNFLRDWLVKHILDTDQLLGKFLKTQGYS
jgi:hemerythrin-like metal-binding protein